MSIITIKGPVSAISIEDIVPSPCYGEYEGPQTFPCTISLNPLCFDDQLTKINIAGINEINVIGVICPLKPPLRLPNLAEVAWILRNTERFQNQLIYTVDRICIIKKGTSISLEPEKIKMFDPKTIGIHTE